MSDPTLYIAFLIAILYGIKTVIHRFVIKDVSAAFIILISAVVYIISTGIYVIIFKKKDIVKDWASNKQYILILAATTFFGLFITNILYFHVVKHTTNINFASIIMALYPVITLIFASMILNETLNTMQLVGFFMTLLGIALMIWYSTTSSHPIA